MRGFRTSEMTIKRLAFACVVLFAAWGPGPARAQTAVQAVALRPAVWRASIEVAASVDAEQSAALAAERGGRVVAVLFASGQSVPAGAVLVQLDDGPEQAQLALDRARLDVANQTAARTAKLMTIAGASQAALEQAEADQAEARAEVSLDQASLRQLQITAPFAGTLGIRKLAAGDYVQQGQAVANIAQNTPLRVLFSIPQTEAAGLGVGDPFTLTVPAQDTGTISVAGKLTALAPAVDVTTNARDAEGSVTGQMAGLLPGMFGSVTLQIGAPQPGFAVPQSALNDNALGRYVYVLTPGKGGVYTLRAVYVTPLGRSGDDTLIGNAGLTEGERVVAVGGFNLTDGASVTLQTP